MELIIIFVCIFDFLLVFPHGIQCSFYASYQEDNRLKVTKINSLITGVNDQWKSQAFYENSFNKSGWDVLEIGTNPALQDEDQAFYAGYIEGFLTQKQIYYHWYNTQQNFCLNITATCNNIRSYIYENFKWIRDRVRSSTDDPYWHQINLFYKQIDGLYSGYRDALKDESENISYEDLLWINYVTDLMTLKESLADKTEEKFIEKSGHCSALIKIVPGFKDVLFAHNSWISYNFMNRVVKRYNFSYHWSQKSVKLIPGSRQAFSSYPGVVTSMDDFYILDSGLVVTETTNNVYNNDIYRHNKPTGQVLETVRSAIANRLARDAESWSYYFSLKNSGTYNNQWMILDLNKFKPGTPPSADFLWILEQMPGKIESKDQTLHLIRHSYWASYNIPFYESIYNYSGYDKKMKEDGPFYSYTDCARAKIFKREHNNVVGIESMVKMIRYNHYKSDPYSLCEKCDPKPNACMSIASRCDLNPESGNYSLNNLKFKLFGAIDAKIGSYSMFKKGQMISIGGPSFGDDLPPFRWSKAQRNDMLHIGQPDLWTFTPLLTNWTLYR